MKLCSGFLLSEHCPSGRNRADTWLAQHGDTATCDRQCRVLPGNGPASCPEHRNSTSLSIFMAVSGCQPWSSGARDGCRGAGCSRAKQVSNPQQPSQVLVSCISWRAARGSLAIERLSAANSVAAFHLHLRAKKKDLLFLVTCFGLLRRTRGGQVSLDL